MNSGRIPIIASGVFHLEPNNFVVNKVHAFSSLLSVIEFIHFGQPFIRLALHSRRYSTAPGHWSDNFIKLIRFMRHEEAERLARVCIRCRADRRDRERFASQGSDVSRCRKSNATRASSLLSLPEAETKGRTTATNGTLYIRKTPSQPTGEQFSIRSSILLKNAWEIGKTKK